MCEAAWVAVVLVPLLARKCRREPRVVLWCLPAEPLPWQNQFSKIAPSWSKLDIGNDNRANGCHLIGQPHPLQMKVPSQNHLGRLQLSWCLPFLAWSWDVCQAPEQPGRRKKHKTLRSTWLSMSITSAVKHILLQPKWRTDALQVCHCLLCRLFASVSRSRKYFVMLRLSVSVGPWKFNLPISFLSLQAKADTIQAAVAEPEETADCGQCLQNEMQRQDESESRLQMLGLSGVEVL